MPTIQCSCGSRFDIPAQASSGNCPQCQQWIPVADIPAAGIPAVGQLEAVQVHSQISSTMLQDLPMVTNIEQHYAQSILAVGLSIPAQAAVAGAAVAAAAASSRSSDSTVRPSRTHKSTARPGTGANIDASSGTHTECRLTQGEFLLDRYEIQRKIGQGGMSSVYEAHDHVRDEAVALKILLPHLVHQPRMQERFLQEGRISSNFSHPNIVRVYDLHQTETHIVLSMELLHGTTLRYDMHRRKQQGQRYRPSEVVHILSQICEALAIVHAAEVVHRDLKPENLWLSLDGTVKVMDFGIARDATRAAHTTGPRGSGTPYYIAPEQLTASRTLDHRADQYSLAVIAYELLTGDIPQGAVEPPHIKNAQIPKRLSQAVFRGLDANPARRYPTIHAFQTALQFDRKLPLVARAGLMAIAVAGLGSGGYAFARWGMPLLEPQASPVWATLQPMASKEREPIEFSVKDPQSALPSSALEFQLLNDAPAGATINGDGMVRWTPDERQAPKKHAFKVMAIISENGSTRKEERTVNIEVAEVFDPPLFETPASAKAIEHQELVIDIAATDPNEPRIGLHYELENPPGGMSIDARTGRLRWTPGEDMGGVHLDIPIRVSLAGHADPPVATTRRLVIDVEEAIDTLTFTSTERLAAEVGRPVQTKITTHDPNLPALNTFYRLRGGDRLGLTIDPKSGDLAWTPSEETSGKSFEVTVEACRDNAGKIQVVGQQTLKLTVAEYKPAPEPKDDAEAPSPSDAARAQTVPALPPAPTAPVSAPIGQPGTCPSNAGGPKPNVPNPSVPNPGGPCPTQPASGGGSTCKPGSSGPGNHGLPGVGMPGNGQPGRVILDVVDAAVKIHQRQEPATRHPASNNHGNNHGNQTLPVIPFPPQPANKPRTNQIPLPANGNTGVAGGLGTSPLRGSHPGSSNQNRRQQYEASRNPISPKSVQPNVNRSRPAPINQVPALESMLKQKIQQELRSRGR